MSSSISHVGSFHRDVVGLSTLDDEPFWGRRDVFDWLDASCRSNVGVWLAGPSGIGKTRCVLEWALQKQTQHQSIKIVFVPARRAQTIEQLWLVWADLIGIEMPNATPDAILDVSIRLFKTDHVIMILDDVDHLDQAQLYHQMKTHLGDLSDFFAVMTTTQSPGQFADQSQTLAPLPPVEVLAFIEHHGGQPTDEELARLQRAHLMPAELKWATVRAQWMGWDEALTHLIEAADASHVLAIEQFWGALTPTQQSLLELLCLFTDGVPSSWLGNLFAGQDAGWPDAMTLLMQRGVLFTRRLGEHRFVCVQEGLRQYVEGRCGDEGYLHIIAFIESQCELWLSLISRGAAPGLLDLLSDQRRMLERLLKHSEARHHISIVVLSLAMVRHRSYQFELGDHAHLLDEPAHHELQAQLMQMAAQTYREQGDLLRARQLWTRMLASMPEAEPWATIMRTQALLGLSMVALLCEEIEEALSKLEEAQDMCPINDSRLLALCKAQRGRIAFVTGELTESLSYLSQSLTYARRSDDKFLLVRMLHNVGVIHTDTSALELAMVCLQECMQHHLHCPVSLRANNYNALGMVYLRLGSSQEAQVAFSHAVELFERCGSFFGMMMSTSNLAMNALDALDLEEALNYVERALLLSQGLDDLSGLVGVANIHCSILLLDGALERANHVFERRMLPHDDVLHHVNARVCFEHTQLVLRCRARQVDLARAQLDSIRALQVTFDEHAHQYKILELCELFVHWHELLQSKIHHPKTRLPAQWAWLQEAQQVSMALFSRSESVRLMARMIEQDLTARMRVVWSALCHQKRTDQWWLTTDCQWVRTPQAQWIDLSRHGLLVSVLSCVAQHHEEGGCDVYTLIEQVWPDEHIEPDAATNRLYVAISKLRKRGVTLIVNVAGQYLLDDSQSILWLG